MDARVWLGEASRRERRPVTLGSISSSELDRILESGFNWIWLRGVWEQDPTVRERARRCALGLEAMQAALPDLELTDIEGAPLEGVRHEIRAALGGEEGFELLRDDLARRGIHVLLDFSPAVGSAGELERVAAIADGICLVDDFATGTEPEASRALTALQAAIHRVRSIDPKFIVLAEGHLSPLARLTADFALDDVLFEALVTKDASRVRERLRAGSRFVRYLEIHGGRRARDLFEGPSYLAAAVLAYLPPGVALFQDGQREGRRLRQDARLVRRRDEAPDEEVEAFHESLFEVLFRTEALGGHYSVRPVREAWAENSTHDQFVLTLREGVAGEWLLVAVNFGPLRGQCYVDLSPLEPAGRTWVLQDLSSLAIYERDGDDLASRGLYLDLAPWDYNVFEVRLGAKLL